MFSVHRIVSAAAVACMAALAGADTDIAIIEVRGGLAEQPSPFAWLEGGGSFGTLAEVVEAMDELAGDPMYEGVLIRLKDAQLPAVHVEEIGQSIAALRQSGKRVHVFAENYGNGEIALASFADESIVQLGGSVSLTGLHMEEMFLADTLAWIGVRPQMIQVGDYKGANEMFMRSEPSEAWDRNVNRLLDGMYETNRALLMGNLGLSESELDEAMRQGWFSDAERAVRLGLVDTVVDLPELSGHLEAAYGEAIAWHEIAPAGAGGFDPSNPFAMLRMLSTPPTHKPSRDTIAVLHVVGTIVDGDSSSGGLLGGQSVGSRTIRRAIEDIRDEDLVRGVVVRIDSPGGSAIASEIMWQGLRRLAEEKPVWVSVGSMAASGGYYTAVGGDRIYVNPSSIVGSIGVVGGKFSMGELLDRLHVNVVERSRGPRADLFSTVSPWDNEQSAFIRDRMRETYDLFTARVAAGREGIDLSKTAEGRLFVGSHAVELGMADEIGSLGDAVGDLAEELSLGRYDVMSYPGPKSFDEMLEEMLGGFVRSPLGGGAAAGLSRAAEEIAGPRAWVQISNAGRAVQGFRTEPVQVVMPRVLIFD